MSGNWDADHSTSTAIVKSEVSTDFHYPLDLTCNVPRPTRGQTVPYTIQPLEDTNQTSRTQLLPMINGCSLTSSPTSSSSSIEHEDEAMGYNPTGSTVSQLSIFRRQTNNPLQVIFVNFDVRYINTQAHKCPWGFLRMKFPWDHITHHFIKVR